jgi:hypothetical protein
MFRFHKNYFAFTGLLLVIEILIALFVHDRFVRPYVGDFLVVILIYCFIKSFLNFPVIITAFAVLLFAYAIEIAQYFNLVSLLGFQNHSILRIIIGSSFEWMDMVAYTLGIVVLLWLEIVQANKRRKIDTGNE